MENIDFHTLCNIKTMVSTEIKMRFLSSLEHFQSDPFDILSEVAFFLKKIHKVFKNKVHGCSIPLMPCIEGEVKFSLISKNKATHGQKYNQ